jgi:hypothetical protein
MASILSPPFVKKKVKRNKRRNERRFQRKKRRQKKNPVGNLTWTFILQNQLHLNPLSRGFLPLISEKCINNSVQSINLHFHQGKEIKRNTYRLTFTQGESKPPSSRQRALIAASHLTGQDVSSTASVYQARNNPELPIAIDSGASVSVTPHIRDFHGPLQKCPTKY